MNSLPEKYSSQEIEDKWYKHWESSGYFKSEPDEREAFSIVIPPPNVTGVLHMGHMLNNTIQDVLIRKSRLDGKNACWVPGTDHASIATEAKVVRMLREQGVKKSDLTREEFLEYAWKWKEEYGGIILKQLRKLGASCDWDRTAFTMDEVRSSAVIKVFVDLFNKGKLYRKKRMVNWDPKALTVLSNEEVIFNEEKGKLYHVRYRIEESEEYVTIATTRPETILGDTAVAVHPDDPRYAHLRGKRVIVPLVGRSIPVICDDYVTMDFGTGALKVTPAHDVNDYEIGQRHKLETIDIFNEDATINEAGKLYIGKSRFVVRDEIVRDLNKAGHLLKVEDYDHSVGRSERTNAVVEPRLSLQWYVDMKSLAEPALKAVMDDDVEFFPKNQKNVYRHWMENIQDWCISRQLWWGHRIPAWHLGDDIYVAETAGEALENARSKTGNLGLTIEDLKQDEDVLDTWFSSWLWPISVFDGFNNRDELDYYYPTSVLVTGWDIIFLWVARMIMAGYEWEGKRPFDHVYFTGMVRDQKRRKMSKSLGNSPDALKLIDDFGADGVRFGMMSCSPAGGDLLFDEKLCDQGKKFCNKIWNALKLIKGWEVVDNPQPDTNALAVDWIESKVAEAVRQIDKQYKEYRLSEALINIYGLIWTDFCSWYLEMIKPEYGAPIDSTTLESTMSIFSSLCSLLHPFMPFITEEVWHQLGEKNIDCMVTPLKEFPVANDDLISDIDNLKTIVSKIRDIRNQNGMKKKDMLDFTAKRSSSVERLFLLEGITGLIEKLSFVNPIEMVEGKTENDLSFVQGTDEFYVNLGGEVDHGEDINKAKEELTYQRGFLQSVEKKLSNDRFVNNAPAAVVEKERQKMIDVKARIEMLEKKVGPDLKM